MTAKILNGPFKGKSLEVSAVLKWDLGSHGSLSFLTHPEINGLYVAPAANEDQ